MSNVQIILLSILSVLTFIILIIKELFYLWKKLLYLWKVHLTEKLKRQIEEAKILLEEFNKENYKENYNNIKKLNVILENISKEVITID